MKTKRKEKVKEEEKKRKEKKRREKGYAWNRTRDLPYTGPKVYHQATWNTQAKLSKFYY